MSLSEENVKKLHMKGIYTCDPYTSLEWLPYYKRDNPYHCCNWTFRVHKYDDGTYAMWDTYWSGADGFHVQLDDEKFDKFTLLFDLDDVKRVNINDFYDYNEEDRWHVALDSAGYQYSKYYFVKKDAKKNKEAQLERLHMELQSLKNQVKWKEQEIEDVLNREE